MRCVQLFLVLVREEKDRLSHVSNVALHQERLVLRYQINCIPSGHVAIVGYREAGGVEIEADVSYAPAGNGGPDGPPVEHAGKHEVIRVARPARGLSNPILSGNAISYSRHLDSRG
jgi:hypothetical protein